MAALATGQGGQGGVAFDLGQRVADAKSSAHGTVRYVGTVPTSKKAEAVYVGVEWDSDKRGKHDGSVTTEDGAKHQLFTCRAGCGSFVKPGKICAGTSLLEATKERYDPSANLGMEEDKVLSTVENARTGEEVPVMLVGLRHINEKRKMGVISNVCFTGAPIATVGPAGQFAKACPKVESMALVNTLLDDWEEVGRICGDIPKLRSLDLSSNRLVPFPLPLAAASALRGVGGPCASVGSSFASLVSLTLNRMLGGAGPRGTGALSWAHVEALASIAPSLKELSLVDNGISSLAGREAGGEAGGEAGEGEGEEPAAIEGFANLTTLILSINLISDWGEVWRFRRLPKLEQLHVNGNRLRSVRWWGKKVQAESTGAEAAAAVAAATAAAAAASETKAGSSAVGTTRRGGECCINPGASAKLYSGDDVVAQALKVQTENMERKRALLTADTSFPALRILTLANNALEGWDSVEALNNLIFLENLRVLQGNSGLRAHLPGVSAHHEAIARLPDLSTLDGSPVKARARRDAELIYLRGALYQALSSGDWDRWEAERKAVAGAGADGLAVRPREEERDCEGRRGAPLPRFRFRCFAMPCYAVLSPFLCSESLCPALLRPAPSPPPPPPSITSARTTDARTHTRHAQNHRPRQKSSRLFSKNTLRSRGCSRSMVSPMSRVPAPRVRARVRHKGERRHSASRSP